ncbi:MAG: Gfo/Idh/MocA family oxidoreductase [Abditibacteriaceae bacterium]
MALVLIFRQNSAIKTFTDSSWRFSLNEPKRCLMIGAGGMAHSWIHEFWPPFRGRAEIVALVDVNPNTLREAGDFLELSVSQRFTQMATAFDAVEADFCCIVTPPAFHQQAVELACERKFDILSEKPIADTWQACCEIYQTVQAAGVKMMVTQNYRYSPRIATLKKAISELGLVNYVVSRYASDWRERKEGWYIHHAPHPILVDCAIHHFDQIRNLSNADCHTISGYSYNPATLRGGADAFQGGASFDGDACALFTLRMNSGSFAQYEGSNIASGKTNSWHEEYYRVECEGGAAVLDSDNSVRIEERSGHVTNVRELPLEELTQVGHGAIIEQFLNWLDGDATPVTVLEDNIRSNALMFAAIESAAQSTLVDVNAMIKNLEKCD